MAASTQRSQVSAATFLLNGRVQHKPFLACLYKPISAEAKVQKIYIWKLALTDLQFYWLISFHSILQGHFGPQIKFTAKCILYILVLLWLFFI